MTSPVPPAPSATAALRTVLRYLPRYRGALWIGLATLVLGQLLQVLAPQFLRRALTALDPKSAAFDATSAGAVAVWLALLYVGVTLVQGLLAYLTRRRIIGLSRLFERDLKRDVFGRLVSLPLSFFDRMRTGDLLSRLTSDIEAVRFSVGPGVMYLAQTAVRAPAALVAMALMEWRLTLVLLFPLAAIAVVVRLISPSILARSRAVQDRLGDLSTKAQESFAGARVVRAYALEDREREEFRGKNASLLVETLGLARSRAVMSGSFRLVGDLALLSVVWLGGRLVMGHTTDVPTLIAFLLYLDMLLWPMISLGYVLASYQRASAAMARLDEVCLHPAEPATTIPEPPALPARFRGALATRGLTFAYPGSARPALEDVTVEVPAGSTLALVGPVGSGKSTLAGLFARLYDVPSGTVFLDGYDVDAIPLHRLRAAFAFVPQDGFLFSETLHENLSFGSRETLLPDRVLRAAHDAGLEDDLAEFPLGLDTVVGERGVTLSGGQRQRATLARALLSDAPVLVLDDALSAVDTRTEARILDRLKDARGGRTAVIVAHRLSTIRDADLIVVLDGGRVVESGTHDELSRAGGWYERTWRLQRLSAEIEELA